MVFELYSDPKENTPGGKRLLSGGTNFPHNRIVTSREGSAQNWCIVFWNSVYL